jgi:hypothetical protein
MINSTTPLMTTTTRTSGSGGTITEYWDQDGNRVKVIHTEAGNKAKLED